MALYYADVFADFQDETGKKATIRYPTNVQYDTATPASMADVITGGADLITALNVLTMDKITEYRICLIVPGGGAAPNVASNNQVFAFTRVLDSGGNKSGFQVPAWDDIVFSKNGDYMLSDAYNLAAVDVAELLRNPNTNLALMDSVEWSQSRGHKARHIPSE